MLRKVLRSKTVDPEILELTEKYASDPEDILDMIVELHASKGALTEESIEKIARAVNIPPEKAFGIASFYSMLQTPKESIRVCDGPACWLKGASLVQTAYASAEKKNEDPLQPVKTVTRSSCLGLCDIAPAVLSGEDQLGPIKIDQNNNLNLDSEAGIPMYHLPLPGEERVLLRDAEKIDPFSIDSAVEFGAYQSLMAAITKPREQILNELEISGLRGRGGAGFPVGRKWRFVAEAARDEKFVVCNADESEPLTFKDRVLMDVNPHKVLEGMLLAGYAVGSDTGYIYIRGEYTSQAGKLATAIQQAEEKGFLGENIQGSDFSFHIHLHRGAGAYICGEETALLESLEGKRGEPRVRPPYPASFGYHGFPTIVNNVESFAYVPDIVKNGGSWYLTLGDPSMPGTKLFTLLGHVNHACLFEAPYGITIRDAIDKFGGGMREGSEFHFALTGGAAGTIVSSDYLDTPIGYSSTGSDISLGSGAILVCDQSVSPVSLLRELMYFFEVESCGKCTPCRVGTRNARLLLDKMVSKSNPNSNREILKDIANNLKNASFCGLGQAAAMPIQSAMYNFADLFK